MKQLYRNKSIIITVIIITVIFSKILLFKPCVRLYVWESENFELNKTVFETEGHGDRKETEEIVRIARWMNTEPVMFSLINDAFLPFVFSWLCNTKEMGIHHRVLLIATDTTTKEKIRSLWPSINVTAIRVDNSLHGTQTYSQAGYIRLIIRRTKLLLALLDHGIETFLFEVDSLWLTNTIPLLRSHKGKYDIVSNGISGKIERVSGGFLYLFPTKRTVAVFNVLNNILVRMDKKLQELPKEQCISEGENDQEFLSKLVNMKFAGVRSKIYPLTEFADGKWYSLSETDRQTNEPFLINFNWMVGNDNKISRAKHWGHWFTKNDSSCDDHQVRKILTRKRTEATQ